MPLPTKTDIAYSRAVFTLVALARQILPQAPVEARAARLASDLVMAALVNDKPPTIIGDKRPSVTVSTERVADIYAAAIVMTTGSATPHEQAAFMDRMLKGFLHTVATDPAHPLHESYLKTLPAKDPDDGATKPLN